MRRTFRPLIVVGPCLALLACRVALAPASAAVAAAAAAASQPAATQPESDWAYLDNGKMRVGFKKSSGGAIGYLSRSGSARNVVNSFDRGRLIQQSYYGKLDGSFWDKKPWRWNPVQGGDWRGAPAKLLDLKTDGRTSLDAKTRPKHWATGKDVDDVVMEQWVTLEGDVVHVRFQMTYSGSDSHPEADQEIPAVFLEPRFDELVLYTGDRPWTGEPLDRSKPAWPNESRRMTEHWAAYVDKEGLAVGVFVPVADGLTCYRYGDQGKDACSYLAPLTRFAVTPGKMFTYDLYLTLGTVEEVRTRFAQIRKNRGA